MDLAQNGPYAIDWNFIWKTLEFDARNARTELNRATAEAIRQLPDSVALTIKDGNPKDALVRPVPWAEQRLGREFVHFKDRNLRASGLYISYLKKNPAVFINYATQHAKSFLNMKEFLEIQTPEKMASYLRTSVESALSLVGDGKSERWYGEHLRSGVYARSSQPTRN